MSYIPLLTLDKKTLFCKPKEKVSLLTLPEILPKNKPLEKISKKHKKTGEANTCPSCAFNRHTTHIWASCARFIRLLLTAEETLLPSAALRA